MIPESELTPLLTGLLQALIMLAGPVVGAVFVTGILTGFVQASTGIQDPAIGQVLRLAGGSVALFVAGGWMVGVASRFALWLYSDFSRFLGL